MTIMPSNNKTRLFIGMLAMILLGGALARISHHHQQQDIKPLERQLGHPGENCGIGTECDCKSDQGRVYFFFLGLIIKDEGFCVPGKIAEIINTLPFFTCCYEDDF
jgi:hypothetical protein